MAFISQYIGKLFLDTEDDNNKKVIMEDIKQGRSEYIAQAQCHLAFLKKVDEASEWLHQDHVIRNAIRRYETIWLPLASEHSNITPPLDVHWVWHVHMLCPVKYAADCMEILGTIPDHRFTKYEDTRTKRYWTASEPYDVNYEEITKDEQTSFTSKITYDIVAASARQKEFYYNVSLPHFTNKHFLESAVKRYENFVGLKKDNRNLFLVPMYDIDLIWHTHQLRPLNYRKSMETFLGYVMGHDDSTTDRTAGSKLTEATEATKKVWEKTYRDEPYAIAGTKYRGSSSRGTLYKPTHGEEGQLFKSTYSVHVNKVQLTGDIRDKYKIKGIIYNQMFQVGRRDLPLRKGPPFVWEIGEMPKEEYTQIGILDFKLSWDEFYNSVYLILKLDRKDGIKRTLFGEMVVGIQFKLKTSTFGQYFKGPDDTKAFFELTGNGKEKYAGVKAVIHIEASRSPYSDATLKVTKNDFEKKVLDPSDDIWHHVPLLFRPSDQKWTCHVATHKLLDYNDSVPYEVRVIHSVVLRTSVVQVYYKGQLSVVSHLIGTEQLPNHNQVTGDKIPYLNTAQGDRAMLIKNNNGDWGIIKASWAGFKRGRAPRSRYDKGIKGNPGHFEFTLTELETGSCSSDTLTARGVNDYIMINRSRLQVNDGELTLDMNATDRTETIAAIFSACVLYVLCEPRYNVPGMPQKEVTRKPAGEFIPFFDAVGYRIAVPSNSWLYWHCWRREHDCMYRYRDSDDSDDETSPDQNAALGINGCEESAMMDTTDDDNFCPWGEGGAEDAEDAGVSTIFSSIGNYLSGGGHDSAGGGHDSGGSGGGGCGGCGSSCGISDSGGGSGWGSDSGGGGYSGGDSGGYSGGGGSSCATSSGGGGGGCGSSCGSSCGGGGGCGSDD